MPRIAKPKPFCANACGALAWNWAGKYCSNKCQQDHAISTWTTDWLHNKIPNKSISVYRVRVALIHLYGAKCQTCGWSEINPVTESVPVQVDHRDGNTENNQRENVRLLCPNCHALTPNWGALNARKPHGGYLHRKSASST